MSFDSQVAARRADRNLHVEWPTVFVWSGRSLKYSFRLVMLTRLHPVAANPVSAVQVLPAAKNR